MKFSEMFLSYIIIQVISVCLAFPDIIDQLKQENANQLVTLIDNVGLTSTLKDQTQGPFTVLAPTDAAFAKIPQADLNALLADSEALKNTLLYHVINGELFTWDITSGMLVPSLSGRKIRIVTGGGSHYFGDALAIKEEIQASNGVIYLIDEVMSIPEGSILDVLKNPDYNLTSFLGLVSSLHLDTLLNSTNQRYTVFAPTDSAIQNLPAPLLSSLQNDQGNKRRVITYHLHEGLVHSSSLNKDGSITTDYRGHYIHLKHDSSTGEPILNELARIVVADIEADNGVVHVISHVLLPSSLVSIIG